MHSRNINEIIRTFNSSEIEGLSEAQAKKNILSYGPNELPSPKKNSVILKFLMQFNDFMIYTLLAAAAISFGISYINGEPDWIEPSIILIIILVNAAIGVIQETKAEHSLNALRKMAAPHATVLRSGRWSQVFSAQLVPGDIIMLETGCMIPADCRILTSHNLMTDEAALTGESQPVSKYPDILPENTAPNDRYNMLFSGCTVCCGHGTALVTNTGISTEFGKIAGMLMREDSPDTPLQKRLARTGKMLSITALIICIIIFIMGVVKSHPIPDMFMTAVSLAVAAIPEGLPAIVTIMLSLGVTRMVSNKAIIRKLPAVETLGSTTIICSDKTGTLTQNKMSVSKMYDCNSEISIHSEHGRHLLSLGVLCSNSIMQKETIIGEPTENALIAAADAASLPIERIRNMCPRVREIPFDSTRKLMTTIHRYNNSLLSITKGAPDILVHLCTSCHTENSDIKPITSSVRSTLLKANSRLASEGLRVIALAYKTNLFDCADKTAESALTFYGFIAMIDPPRPEAAASVHICRQAGIRPVMITGDHAATAAKIAFDLGIIRQQEEVISGTELNELSDTQLAKSIGKYGVFARVSPEHKLRIVKALQQNGEIVAMTGDGVNDAPALKAADIGCSMGLSGTDVAKSASDMILEDDNFATIALAIREGRNIYDSIRKAIHFLISCNIGEIMTIFSAILLGLAAPLCPVQLLWINLITDSLPALSLGAEPADSRIMKRKPISPKKGIFADGLGISIAAEGLLIGSLALISYSLGLNEDASTANTMCFAVLGLSQLFHAFNVRSDFSILQIGIFSNTKLVWSFVLCAALQAAVICVPALNLIFNTISLNPGEWATVLILSFVPVIVKELQKFVSDRLHSNFS